MQKQPNNAIRILMVDDHPLQIEGYKAVLAYNHAKIPLQVTECYDVEAAHRVLTGKRADFDIVFLDCRMPPSAALRIASGENLANLVRQHLPFCKLVMVTAHCEAFLLYDTIRKIAPEGLLVKSDIDASELLIAFREILDGNTHYTETVHQAIQGLLSKQSYLDNYNRQIIMLLSKGIRTKNIPQHLNLSLSAVEKRKALIKDYLCVDSGTDEDIVEEARRRGFI
ncbi:MAG: response regulator transcription factor [Flavobacterium sp.]|nr:MAG: response regulator transcription factor [Flavobacterium sp.]